MRWNPTRVSLSTPSVPRKSRSPSARTIPPRSSKRTQVAILALGCLAFFLVNQVPVLGAIVMIVFVGLTAFGAALRTKLGATRIDANFVPEP